MVNVSFSLSYFVRDIQDILQLVDIPLILVILLLPVQATLPLLVGDIPLLLEATPLFQVTHLLVATLLPLVEAIHHLQVSVNKQ